MKNKSIIGTQYVSRSNAWRAVRNYQNSNQSDKRTYEVFRVEGTNNLWEIDLY